jgi:hypothetical protein
MQYAIFSIFWGIFFEHVVAVSTQLCKGEIGQWPQFNVHRVRYAGGSPVSVAVFNAALLLDRILRSMLLGSGINTYNTYKHTSPICAACWILSNLVDVVLDRDVCRGV